jgi:hypothetical protein
MSLKIPLKMAVAYDCFSAGALAVARMQPLCDRLHSEFEIETALWGFDEVEHLPHQEIRAADEMVEADVVIFAMLESDALPARIRDWTELWARKKRDHASLLVVLTGPENRALAEYFRQISDTGGMDFFCEPLEPVGREVEAEPPAFPPLDERYLVPATAIASSQRFQPYQLRDWGIND